MWIQSWLLWHVHDHVVGIIWTIEKIVICTIHFWPNIIKFIYGGRNNEGTCNPKEKREKVKLGGVSDSGQK